jgi:hypothetical protein
MLNMGQTQEGKPQIVTNYMSDAWLGGLVQQ